jgi:hypothetical protein
MENMLQSMMKRFPLFIVMGFMIVVVSLIIGYANAQAAQDYFAIDKATRETATQWIQVRAGGESTVVWLPYFKFLGVAMILGGITMALGVIATRLQELGKKVMTSVPKSARMPIPPRPTAVWLMRGFMMMGMMVILIGFIVSLVTAGTASAVYSNPIPAIDGAANGSSLLNQLGSVHATEAWLEAFKFVGIAFLFLSIVNGLHVIIFALRYQRTAIPQVVEHLPDTAPIFVPADVPVPAD